MCGSYIRVIRDLSISVSDKLIRNLRKSLREKQLTEKERTGLINQLAHVLKYSESNCIKDI